MHNSDPGLLMGYLNKKPNKTCSMPIDKDDEIGLSWNIHSSHWNILLNTLDKVLRVKAIILLKLRPHETNVFVLEGLLHVNPD
jgi:hypothetical protein